MFFITDFITTVNKKTTGDIIIDESDKWYNKSQRPFINNLIKLGYLERIEWDKLKKLKDIPFDMNYKKAKELSKDKKLPRRRNASTWGKIIEKINNSDEDVIYIKPNEIISLRTHCHYDSTNKYLTWLRDLEYIQIIKKDRYFGFNIKRIKQIPDNLTVSLAQKFLYDNMYKRSIKIDKIKEQMNNI